MIRWLGFIWGVGVAGSIAAPPGVSAGSPEGRCASDIIVKYGPACLVTLSGDGEIEVHGKASSSLRALQRRFDLRDGRRLFRSPPATAAELYQSLGLGNIIMLRCRTGAASDAVAALRRHPAVAYAETGLCFEPAGLPNDPYVAPAGVWSSGAWGQPYPDLWGLQTIAADSLWSAGARGAGRVVAVIDSGVDTAHEDVPNLWTNLAELQGVPGFDDDNNGYVDDLHGYDFVNDDPDPSDDLGHGTHGCGTIAAPVNGVGIVGVAPEAQIMVLKGLPGDGPGGVGPLIEAVQYAAEHGAAVINNGYGALGSSAALADAFHYADALGCVSIAAAMNFNVDAALFTPANIDTVVAVAATDPADVRAAFSNWGQIIDVAAPGVDILSLRGAGTDLYLGDPDYVPGARFVPAFDRDARYYRSDGTSMACTHVAGLAAALRSAAADLGPGVIRVALRTGTDDLGAPGFDPLYGYGRINAAAALQFVTDCNGNGRPDPCDLDCAASGCAADGCGASVDCNGNHFPDECEPGGLEDCNGNRTVDLCELFDGSAADCNANGIPDDCDLGGGSPDADDNGILDECQVRLFVDASARGAGSGLSWADAFVEVQEALDAAASSTAVWVEIWVAAGSYLPDRGSGDRDQAFELTGKVAVYGGFAGTEQNRTERDWRLHPTILSGDLQGNDDPAGFPGGASYLDNSAGVVRISGPGADPVLDGFIIRGGMAQSGGGVSIIDAAPQIVNCVITANFAEAGGGVSVAGKSLPMLINCALAGNFADDAGGGMQVLGGSPLLINCAWTGNHADDGGGLFCSGAAPSLVNCSLAGNSASAAGGGVYGTAGALPALTNCIVWNNVAADGPPGTGQIAGLAVVNYSCVQDWQAGGTGNLAADPLFHDVDGADDVLGTPDDDLRLTAFSPALDAGHNNALPPDVTDLDDDGDLAELLPIDAGGVPRRLDAPAVDPDPGDPGTTGPPVVDMGAFEHSPIAFVDASARGAANGRTWSDAFTDVQDALAAAAAPGSLITEVWVAAGVYTPDRGTAERGLAFALADGLAMFGGFSGSETFRQQRDWRSYETVLSGDLLADDGPLFQNNSDNSCHVLVADDPGSAARLDGFTVTAGHADCTGDGDRGAGVWIGRGDLQLVNCRFLHNRAEIQGGAVDASPAAGLGVVNCVFGGNQAGFRGGALSVEAVGVTLANCLFSGNQAGTGGGALSSHGAAVVVHQGTFSLNQADEFGGAIHGSAGGSIQLANSILWGNSTAAGRSEADQLLGDAVAVDHCCIQGWSGALGGTGNIAADPGLTDPDGADDIPGTADDQARLSAGSPCIDAAANRMIAADLLDLDDDGDIDEPLPLDLDWRPRLLNDPTQVADRRESGAGPAIADMGAYEHQAVVHVHASATGSNDGLRWADAFRDLQDALEQVADPLSVTPEVWVAAGTYTPDRGTADRSATFHLHDGVAVYGGFSGTETVRAQRDWLTQPTVLSGDLLGDDGAGFTGIADNSCHVLTTSFTAATAVLDGFRIVGGHADCGGADDYGAGVYNRAGSPILRHCQVHRNRAIRWGGGMHNWLPGSPQLISCRIDGNRAEDWGGGVTAHGSTPTAVNCRFSGNQAGAIGGAFANVGGSLTLVNNSVISNTAPLQGAGIFSTAGSTAVIVNTILWGNQTATGTDQFAQLTGGTVQIDYSCIQGHTGILGGFGNTGADPGFQDADGPDDVAGTDDDDVSLQSCSPLIDAGENAAVIQGPAGDLFGDPRIVDGNADGTALVDIGAVESQEVVACCTADFDGNGLVSAPDLAFVLGAWGPNPGHPADLTGDGAVDGADLAPVLGAWGRCP